MQVRSLLVLLVGFSFLGIAAVAEDGTVVIDAVEVTGHLPLIAPPVVTGYPACDPCSNSCCDPCAGGVTYGTPMTYGGAMGAGGYVSP